MLIAEAFRGHLDELSTDLLQLLREVSQLNLLEEQVCRNQLDMDALSSMQDLVGSMGSTGHYMRDRMNEELIFRI
jgi:hypothetical protein